MIRTVLGDIPAEDLGVCDAHDHLFFRSAALPGEELADRDAARRELQTFADAGGRALVQWTPMGLGPDPDGLAAISRATGVHVIAATGRHQPIHYEDRDTLPDRDLAATFVAEIEDAMEGSDAVRAGVIKVGGQYHRLGAYEERTFAAAAEAALATGVTVCVHTELGTHGGAILERFAALGLPPDRVVLGHLNRNPDLGLHLDLVRAGAFLAYDGPSRANHRTDWRLFDLLHGMAEAGELGQIMLGADAATRSATWVAGGGPGMRGLLETTGARVQRELGAGALQQMFVRNPARAFSVQARATRRPAAAA